MNSPDVPSPKVKDPDQHHHGDLAEALVDAAWLLIEESGMEGLTLRAAARKVGVSPMATYYHFKNKAALVAAVATRGFERLRASMIEAADSEEATLLALRSLGVAYAVFAVRHPGVFRVMFGVELAADEHPQLRQAAAATLDTLVSAFKGAGDSGAIRSGDVGRVALTAWATVHGVATLLVSAQLGPVTVENAENQSKVVLSGLRDGLRPPGSTES